MKQGPPFEPFKLSEPVAVLPGQATIFDALPHSSPPFEPPARTLSAVSLYSGLGGMDLAAEAAGFSTVAVCEVEPFCRHYLSYYWPEVHQFESDEAITESTLAALGIRPGDIDLLYGGPPCQGASISGRRLGEADSRWRWPEYIRVASILRPAWLVAENPRGLLSLGRTKPFRAIEAALTDLGYRVGWSVFGAEALGAPHKRERVFLIGKLADTLGSQPERARAAGGMASAAGEHQSGEEERQWVRHAAFGGNIPGKPTMANPTGAGLSQRRDGGPALYLQQQAAQRGGLEAGGELADSAGIGRREGRPKPAWAQGRPDAAERGGPGPAAFTMAHAGCQGQPAGRTGSGQAATGEVLHVGPTDSGATLAHAERAEWGQSAENRRHGPNGHDAGWQQELCEPESDSKPMGHAQKQPKRAGLRAGKHARVGSGRPGHTDGQDAGSHTDRGTEEARQPLATLGSPVDGISSGVFRDTDKPVPETPHYQGPRPIWQPNHPWPAGPGEQQKDWEEPRLVASEPFRVPRLKALGNACVPDMFYPIALAIAKQLRGEL